MDSDRRSAVSSVYSDSRRPPGAAAPAHQPRPSGVSTLYEADPRARRDSASTFFSPTAPARAGGAGYNRQSYFDTGREEPLRDPDTPKGDWDVYADFNNTGPRYSTAFGLGNEQGYQPIGTPTGKLVDDPEHGQQAEFVTVPALGPDWKADELHAMTKSGRREVKSEARKQKWNDWRRGRSGGRWFNRKMVVFFVFILCIIAGIALYFTIPRVPSFQFNSDAPLTNATSELSEKIPTDWSRTPANFSFAAMADLRIDTGGNYIPIHLKKIRARIIDPDSGFQVAEGELKNQRFSANKKSHLSLPLNFSYAAVNDSDNTWLNWYNACKNRVNYADNKRPGVNFNLALDMTIFGLFGTKHDGAQVLNAGCPIELPVTSV